MTEYAQTLYTMDFTSAGVQMWLARLEQHSALDGSPNSQNLVRHDAASLNHPSPIRLEALGGAYFGDLVGQPGAMLDVTVRFTFPKSRNVHGYTVPLPALSLAEYSALFDVSVLRLKARNMPERSSFHGQICASPRATWRAVPGGDGRTVEAHVVANLTAGCDYATLVIVNTDWSDADPFDDTHYWSDGASITWHASIVDPHQAWTVRTPPLSTDGPTSINKVLVDANGDSYVLDGRVVDVYGDGTYACDSCGGWLRKIDKNTGGQVWAVDLAIDRIYDVTLTDPDPTNGLGSVIVVAGIEGYGPKLKAYELATGSQRYSVVPWTDRGQAGEYAMDPLNLTSGPQGGSTMKVCCIAPPAGMSRHPSISRLSAVLESSTARTSTPDSGPGGCGAARTGRRSIKSALKSETGTTTPMGRMSTGGSYLGSSSSTATELRIRASMGPISTPRV